MEQDTRVIQRTGSSSYTVSLLTGWVEDTGSAGSEVALHRLGNSVVIFPTSEQTEIESDAEKPLLSFKSTGLEPEEVEKSIKSLYVRGADKIKIDIEGAKHHRQRVREAVSELTGMVVVSETSEEIVIRKVVEGSDIQLDDSIKRLSELSVTALRESIRKAMGEESPKYSTSVSGFEKLKTRCERFLTEGISDPGSLVDTDLRLSEVFYAEMCVRELSYVVEGAKYISSVPSETNPVSDKKHEILDLMDKATLSIRGGTGAYLDAHRSGYVQPEFRATLSRSVNTDHRLDGAFDEDRQEPVQDKVVRFLRSAIRRGNRLADIADRRRIVDGQSC